MRILVPGGLASFIKVQLTGGLFLSRGWAGHEVINCPDITCVWACHVTMETNIEKEGY